MGEASTLRARRQSGRVAGLRLFWAARLALPSAGADGRVLLPGERRPGLAGGARVPAVLPGRLHRHPRVRWRWHRLSPREPARARPAALGCAYLRDPAGTGPVAGPRAGAGADRAGLRAARACIPRQGGLALTRRLFLLAPLGLALSACQPVFTTSGAWSGQPSPPVSTANSHIVATDDGRVVVVGGFNPQTGEPLGQAVVFDPASSRWTDAAPIPEPRADDVAVPLADGTVLLTAGRGANGPQLYRSTWIFDPSRNRWNRVGDLHTARLSPSAVRLSDGRVLLVAGSVVREDLATAGASPNPDQAVASSELYDPATKNWHTGH